MNSLTDTTPSATTFVATPAVSSRNELAESTSGWDRFFFRETVPYGMALMRITLPLILFGLVAQRWAAARELFSLDGATAPLAVNYGYLVYLPEFSGSVAVALFTVLGFCLLTSALGWYTRLSLVISCVLYFYFNMVDSLSTMTKYSVIATHLLVLLAVSQCGAIWSVDAWLADRRKTGWSPGPNPNRPRFPIWPTRLVQLLIGIVYFGASITKLHTPAYFNGDQMTFWMMADLNWENPLGERLVPYPVVSVVMAYIAIIWEVLFVFVVWNRWGRMAVISLGIAFHTGTHFVLGLLVFPLVCFSAYLAFIDEGDIQWFAQHIRRLRRKLPAGLRTATFWKSKHPRIQELDPETSRFWRTVHSAAYPVAMVAIVVIGLEVEYRLDRYGLRRPEGPYKLEPVDPERVAQLLQHGEPIRDVDKFHSFTTGETFVGGVMVNRRTVFKQGETVFAECAMNPPHEDKWVSCDLHDENNHILDRVGMIITREQSRASFAYVLGPVLKPGNYSLVLKTDGRELFRRDITLLDNPDAKSTCTVMNFPQNRTDAIANGDVISFDPSAPPPLQASTLP